MFPLICYQKSFALQQLVLKLQCFDQQLKILVGEVYNLAAFLFH